MNRPLKLVASALLVLTIALARAEEQRPSGPTLPTRSEYFLSIGAGVLQSRDDTASIFAISLSTNKPLPPDSTLVIEFENPSSPESPFVVAGKLDEKGELHARSPRFEPIRNKRSYLVRTKLIAPNDAILATHDQWIWFDLPREIRGAYATKIID